MTAFQHGGRWCRLFASEGKQICAALLGLLLTSSLVNGQDSASIGEWSSVTVWPYVATHAHVLPTGKVLWSPQFGNGDNPYLWDPSTNTNSATVQTGANIFCAGHAFLADGQLLVAGGYKGNYKGIADAY